MTNNNTLHDCDVLISSKINSPYISVIVPVYNQSRTGFLVPCLDSLLAQTLKNIEIICIDDASEDDSLDILLDFAKKNHCFTVAKMKENSRQGTARNRGIDLVKGKYIAFIDSDDMVSNDYFEQLYYVAEKTHSDAVEASFQYIDEAGDPFGSISKPHESKDHALNHESRERLILSHGMIWSYLFSASLFTESDIRFPEKIRYEDTPTFIRLVFKIKKIAPSNDALYKYRQNRFSTNAITPNNPLAIKERLISAKMILTNAKNDGVYLKYKDALDCYFIRVYLVNTLYVISNSDTFKIDRLGLKKMVAYCAKHIPNALRNPFINKMPLYQRLTIKIAIISPTIYLVLRSILRFVSKRNTKLDS